MADRKKLSAPKRYFDVQSIEKFSSGSTLLDCVLGGGWALSRASNIVGDKSTGKTLQAIEGAANFARHFNYDCDIYFDDCEAAFDLEYAEHLGLPEVDLGENDDPILTVEDWFKKLDRVITNAKRPALVVLDSLDALSDKAEMEREIDNTSTFGASKPKQLSSLFRQLIQRLKRNKVTVMVISQVRDNIGVTFGERHTRSGGKALDFYASQVVWLAHKGQLKKTKKGVSRVYGVQIKAKCKKNKVGPPFRECEYPIHFGYGVDDLISCAQFLLETWERSKGHVESLGLTTKADLEKYVKGVPRFTQEEYDEEISNVVPIVKELWAEIEQDFAPTRKKYR